ncbi:MAG: three-helix bundle dimerization domain-containing protein [Thermomicrobiales bacterium]
MRTMVTEAPTDFEAIVALVRREAAEECQVGSCLIAPVLDRCVRDAVGVLWDSRIRTFVPLLALRSVRTCIRCGRCEARHQ